MGALPPNPVRQFESSKRLLLALSGDENALSITNGRWYLTDVVGHDERLDPYLAQLARLPFVRKVRALKLDRRTAPRVDARLRVTTPTGEVEMWVEVKRTHLTRTTAEHLLRQAADQPNLLLFAPVVGRELGDFFVEQGLHFVDLAGNCFVQIGDQYLARIQGQRAEVRPPTEKALRAPAYRVLFALLLDAKLLDATARALAETSGGVSPQTANDVRARLLAQGAIVKTRKGITWVPGRRRQVLDTFVFGFPLLASGLTIGRFRAKQVTPAAIEADLTPRLPAIGEWRWGGGAAAERLTGYYRGDRTILYVREPNLAAIRKLPLVPDPQGNVVLLRPPAPVGFSGPKPDVVHPLLVYADLLLEGHERAREAAAEIYDTYLAEEAK